ncbi:SUMF1/EgtB/PvdO family nonheme iron enzyme [Aeoliella sp.]|uniref:SUMF1/EgtB/PvdO family nonheme iron enzyme n=1 Tax=Aeoliella sp. TaxID=2795800 RepID=UPI003CCB96EE
MWKWGHTKLRSSSCPKTLSIKLILGNLGITHDNRGSNKPATSISWVEAAKFVNWLNTSSGYSPAYKVVDHDLGAEKWQQADVGYTPRFPYRNARALYYLPTLDEWDLAAYGDPAYPGTFYEYPTGSNNIPDGIDSLGDPLFDAIFDDGYANSEPNDITDVGVLSPYGVAGQGGNVGEWLEDNSSQLLALYFGRLAITSNFTSPYFHLNRGSGYSGDGVPATSSYSTLGFRVVKHEKVPEPSTCCIALTLVAIGLGKFRACVGRNQVRGNKAIGSNKGVVLLFPQPRPGAEGRLQA